MAVNPSIRSKDLAAVLQRVAADNADLRAHPPAPLSPEIHLADTLLCTDVEAHDAVDFFDRLRWGGQLIYAARQRTILLDAARRFAAVGFDITHPPASLRCGPIPFLSGHVHFLVARKVLLVRPGIVTDRFTYHVHLTHLNGAATWVVAKETPSLDMVLARLRMRWPMSPVALLEKRARNFSDRIFPTFLAREAQILQRLHDDLPDEYARRIPKLLSIENGPAGLANRIHMTWLRNGGEPISHLEFIRQSVDLIRVLHDVGGVMHLDPRPDNFVLTPLGVGLVDFGSAVCIDENLKQNPLVHSLFQQLMRTSEVQVRLDAMVRAAQVTNPALRAALHRPDKGVDCFCLAQQMTHPHANPDLKDLIAIDPHGSHARALAHLAGQILDPQNPQTPFRTAAQILLAIEQIARGEFPSAPTNAASPFYVEK